MEKKNIIFGATLIFLLAGCGTNDNLEKHSDDTSLELELTLSKDAKVTEYSFEDFGKELDKAISEIPDTTEQYAISGKHVFDSVQGGLDENNVKFESSSNDTTIGIVHVGNNKSCFKDSFKYSQTYINKDNEGKETFKNVITQEYEEEQYLKYDQKGYSYVTIKGKDIETFEPENKDNNEVNNETTVDDKFYIDGNCSDLSTNLSNLFPSNKKGLTSYTLDTLKNFLPFEGYKVSYKITVDEAQKINVYDLILSTDEPFEDYTVYKEKAELKLVTKDSYLAYYKHTESLEFNKKDGDYLTSSQESISKVVDYKDFTFPEDKKDAKLSVDEVDSYTYGILEVGYYLSED